MSSEVNPFSMKYLRSFGLDGNEISAMRQGKLSFGAGGYTLQDESSDTPRPWPENFDWDYLKRCYYADIWGLSEVPARAGDFKFGERRENELGTND